MKKNRSIFHNYKKITLYTLPSGYFKLSPNQEGTPRHQVTLNSILMIVWRPVQSMNEAATHTKAILGMGGKGGGQLTDQGSLNSKDSSIISFSGPAGPCSLN